ncbi:MAG: hypothetical protein EXS09_07255 [Gemmataceae bacterium]|nr:hypothetical protein [Gemmataceae bacterium]
MRIAFLLLFAVPAFAAENTVRFTSPMYFLPPAKAIVFTKAGDPGPGAAKHSAIVSVASLKDEAKLPGDGPYDLWFVPKDGKPIRAIAAWKPKDGANEIKLNDRLGVISFRGEGQPRGTLLVTPEGDDGPETKKHLVIQTAGDTRAELAVLPGDYAVWVVPANGARARRVADKVRVLVGKTATVE